jgi:hypothetical protein
VLNRFFSTVLSIVGALLGAWVYRYPDYQL